MVSVAAITIKRLFNGVIPAVILFILLIVSLYLLNDSTKELSEFITSTKGIGHSFELMVLINFLGVFILTVLIGIKLVVLIRKYRQNASGSRLNARMVVMFTVISVIPVFLVFYFSFQLLDRDIDTQSKELLTEAIGNALKLSRESLNLKQRELLQQTRAISRALYDINSSALAFKLDTLRDRYNANELMVLEGNRIIAFSNVDAEVRPQHPPQDLMLSLKKHTSFVKLDPISETGLTIKVVVPIFANTSRSSLRTSFENHYLYAKYPIDKHLNKLAKQVELAASNYTARKHLREKLKMTYLLTLGLVFMLSLAAAIWAAFFSTDRMVAPITELADATRAVAEGQYDKQLPIKSHDELGFLVKSFNDMTKRIAHASKVAQQSQQQAEEQRAYLLAVLSNLSSGVITIDKHSVLRIINAEASEILGVNLDQYIDQPLSKVAEQHEHIRNFIDSIKPNLDTNKLDWRSQSEIYSKGGRQILLSRGTTLKGDVGEYNDHIVVFDDITALVQAQRDSAWGEVARRLAHEIKNPLTPIQLSAERIRRKYLDIMDKEDAELLDKSTHTIVQQVEAMKTMVNEFSEYARAPKIMLCNLELNSLIQEVTDLYTVSEKNLKLQLSLDSNIPVIEADAGRIRQLLHNLIKNSIEAMQEKQEKTLLIKTQVTEGQSGKSIELQIQDSGDGFPDEIEGRHFEPYITSKPKGTGLGLAIVKRIVEEHHGIVWAENLNPKGAKITIRIPVPSFHTGTAKTEAV